MTEPQPLTPEMLVPKIGDTLIEKGLITPDQLHTALQNQRERRLRGEDAPLTGQILVEMGILERASLDAVVTEQIIKLRAALEENNRELERRVIQRTAELQQALNKLEELNQMKANFVSNISHELRTPLTHLKGYMDLLGTGDLGPTTPNQIHALATMKRAGDRLENLIEDLILFATSEHQQINLHQAPFSLADTCQRVIESVRQAANARGIEISLHSDNNLPLAYGDEEKITWVVKQLLDNAVKFTHTNGNIVAKLDTIGNEVRCTIKDSGIGIPADRIEEVFEAFHQLDGSSTRRYGGTGLGLSLAKKIIESHGSTITVRSDVGKGSEFSFLLDSASAIA